MAFYDPLCRQNQAMKINPDQPAFAQWDGHAITSEPLYLRGGLTVRAYIAAKALQGILSSPTITSGIGKAKGDNARETAKEIIEQSVSAADALIAELNKQP